MVCLHDNGAIIQKFCKLNGIHFYYRPIEDYEVVSYDIGLSIISLIEYIQRDKIVFYCTAGWGRTGSIMFLIILYFKALEDISILTRTLPMSIESHRDRGWSTEQFTLLETEYGKEPSVELFTPDDSESMTEKLNIIYKIVANGINIYHPNGHNINYINYTNPWNDDLGMQNTENISEEITDGDRDNIKRVAIEKIQEELDI
jgi:hypothetical protein